MTDQVCEERILCHFQQTESRAAAVSQNCHIQKVFQNHFKYQKEFFIIHSLKDTVCQFSIKLSSYPSNDHHLKEDLEQ